MDVQFLDLGQKWAFPKHLCRNITAYIIISISAVQSCLFGLMWLPENQGWINSKEKKKKKSRFLRAVEKSSREMWTSPLISHRNSCAVFSSSPALYFTNVWWSSSASVGMCSSHWAVLAPWAGDSSEYFKTTTFIIALHEESRLIQKSYHNNNTSTWCKHKYLTHPREWFSPMLGEKHSSFEEQTTENGGAWVIILLQEICLWEKASENELLEFYCYCTYQWLVSYCKNCHPLAGWWVLQLSTCGSVSSCNGW